jgi:hypothetical protein
MELRVRQLLGKPLLGKPLLVTGRWFRVPFREGRHSGDPSPRTSNQQPATVLLLIALLLASCATAPTTAPPTLAHAIDAAIARPPFQHAFWSILIEEDDGRVLYARNADKLTIPASNRKLFASATIAECLGIDSQLSTEVWRDGDDLIVRGDGDPSLGSWRYERSGDFDALASALRARGITRVHDVIADVSLFDRNTIPGTWKYGNLGSDYAAAVDALTWGESEIPVDRAVPDPALHAATILRDALFMHDIEITGVPRVNAEPRAWAERIASLPSPFIGQLLTTVLKNSHNLYAAETRRRRDVRGRLRARARLPHRRPQPRRRFVPLRRRLRPLARRPRDSGIDGAHPALDERSVAPPVLVADPRATEP